MISGRGKEKKEGNIKGVKKGMAVDRNG